MKGKAVWKKISHNWSWWDSFIGGLIGTGVGFVAAMVIWMTLFEQVRLYRVIGTVLYPVAEPFALVVGMIFFSGRAWHIARMPQAAKQNHKVDYSQATIGGAIIYVIRFHWVSLMFGLLALICAIGLAPSVVDVVRAIAG